MPSNNVMSEKKKALMAYKAKILEEMKYYDVRIDEVKSQGLKTSFVQEPESSDSDEEFPFTIDCGPSVPQLKVQQAMLKTCLQATQELTSLQVLQSEVNVLVDAPEFEGEAPVTEPGVWREVTAECRVDLVPFSISYFVHQPDRQFGPPSYRGLRVVPVKSAHEGELNKSVMPSLTRPSDAVEVLKSYAAAQRSRRSTLARLADKYANMLFMEPMADGGYILKCANLLEVSWSLQNKWSPIAPFHHRMKFDLEYMDESYIKTITQVHRQLSDPSLDTDERTLLLARIIAICLEAKGPTQELYESMSSDPEVAESLKKRRTTLDQEPEAPSARHSNEQKRTEDNDREVMAPPKSLPKKAKPKGKENIGDNRKEKLKRGNSNEDMNGNKKMKIDSKTNANTDKPSNEKTSKNDKATEKSQNTAVETKIDSTKDKLNDKVNDANKKNSEIPKKLNKNNVKTSGKVESEVAGLKSVSDRPESDKVGEKPKISKEKSDVAKTKNIQKVTQKNTEKPKVIQEKSNLDKNSKPKSVAFSKKDAMTVESKTAKETTNAKVSVNPKTVTSTTTRESKTAPNKETVAKTNKKTQDKEENTKTIKRKENKIVENVATKLKPSSNAEEAVKKVKSVTKNKELANKREVKEKQVLNTEKNVPKEVPNNTEKDKTKKVATVKSKPNTEPNKNIKKPQEAPTKTIASIKNKAPLNVENDKLKKTIPKTKLNINFDKTKESTVEKVVEKQKSVAIKRKSNLVDRAQDGADNPPKMKRKTLSDPEIIRNQTNKDNLRRKTSIIDRVKELDNIAKNNVEISERVIPTNNGKIKKSHTDPKINMNKMQKPTKNETRIKTKLMPGSIKTAITGNTNKVFKAGNTEKQNGLMSKIPQKKLSAISEATLKKNPLRISPRKISSKFKTTVDGTKSIQKTTSIPRLLKKPVPKM